jgi:Cdc6-like AAA superfamily ATPase
LALTEVNLPKYTADELHDITIDRAQFTVRPNTVKDELLRIVSMTADGDARVALQILLRAGKKAEDKGLKQLTMEEIRQAGKEARKLKKSYLLRKLNEHQMVIYGVLEKKTKLPSGELYKEYRSLVTSPVVDRAYRNYMKRMVELGLVNVEGYGRWKSYSIVL